MKWLRPTGSTIELVDSKNMTEFAKANGWKPVDTPKRKRRTKEEMIADGDSSRSI